MNTPFINNDLLNGIEPVDAKEYLESTGWAIQDQVSNKALIFSRDDFYSDLVIPISKTVRDYTLRYSEALNLLAEYYNKDKSQILQDIMYFGADIAKFRIISPKTQDGTIPVEDAIKFYTNVKQVVVSSAMSVIEAKPKYSPNIPKRVQELYSNSRIGQTEVGSYIISVILRHAKPPAGENRLLSEIPFERLAFENMNRAIGSLNNITSHRFTENALSESVFNGVSYNLCKHIAEIQEISYGGSIEMSFKWSSRIEKPSSTDDSITLDYFQREEVIRASNILNTNSKVDKVVLHGFVIGLLRPEGSKEGKITLQAHYENRSVKFSAVLGSQRYSKAVKAHDERLQVRCTGEILRTGNYFYMSTVESFDISSEDRFI